jgi:hypothetical protein
VKPLTPKQAAVLHCAVTNPTWGRARIARTLGENPRMVSLRLKVLRARGLITHSPRKNQYK